MCTVKFWVLTNIHVCDLDIFLLQRIFSVKFCCSRKQNGKYKNIGEANKISIFIANYV